MKIFFVLFCGVLVGLVGSLSHGMRLDLWGYNLFVGIVLAVLFLFSVQFFVGVFLKNSVYVWFLGLVAFFVASLAATEVRGSILVLGNLEGFLWLLSLPVVTIVVVKLVKSVFMDRV